MNFEKYFASLEITKSNFANNVVHRNHLVGEVMSSIIQLEQVPTSIKNQIEQVTTSMAYVTRTSFYLETLVHAHSTWTLILAKNI